MNTQKIKWVKNGASIGFGYFAGDECHLEEKTAKELHAAGMVMIIEDVSTLPAEMPAREILIEAGFMNTDALASMSVEELTEIKGIGKATAKKIFDFFETTEA